MRLITEIWGSFRAMPFWVQVWVALILVPVNMASLLFLTQPGGLWVAFLANIAMILNLPILIAERGFSKRMALPHLPFWTVLVLWLLLARPEAQGGYATYLWLVLIVDVISLGFDYPDAWKWWQGDRAVARNEA
ncbi:hypothetical protein RXV86_01905 [Alisedimentitalea sp. MJ-SS2]|uniref:hypothetical protein n=1 Tax=Aliisedimentitalea sp. MJ-SS2 TaxID=3049795 RepID=UPI00291187DB|nr:hypothetical protein [Alisedimentitalea sp. MJ-SS2]MDU8926130.1 hypothetical protein [Alisedimentitalea sp. MJ-SS2]